MTSDSTSCEEYLKQNFITQVMNVMKNSSLIAKYQYNLLIIPQGVDAAAVQFLGGYSWLFSKNTQICL